MSIYQNILTQKGFEDLFNQLYEPLCRSAFRIVQDEHTAEDIVQDVFCTLWRKKEQLEITSFEGYLFRSVYNTAINSFKKRKSQDFNCIEEISVDVPAQSTTPEQKLHYTETQEGINKAIEKLPAACRVIFVLSRFENKSNKEIAHDLELSVKTVENQITKALKLLRQALLFLIFAFQQKF